MRKITFLSILISFTCFSLLYAFLSTLYKPKGILLDELVISTDSVQKTIMLPYYKAIDKASVVNYTTTFDKMDPIDSLVISNLYAYAFKVYINDTCIYQLGDSEQPTSLLWNYFHLIPIDPDLLMSEDNKLLIETYSLHDTGINAITLNSKHAITKRVALQNFIRNDMSLIFIGAGLIVSILLFSLYRLMHNNRLRLPFLYFGISACSVSLFLFEYTFRISSGSLEFYFILRKIFLIAIYNAVVFFYLALKKYIGNTNKHHYYVLLVYSLIIFCIIISSSYPSLRKVSDVTNYLLFFLLILIVLLSRKVKDKYMYFLFSFANLGFIQSIMILVLRENALNLFLFAYMISIIGVGLTSIIQIQNENYTLYHKTLVDPLTGLFNRNILEDLSLQKNSYLVFIDIDNFKYYNDTYGHEKGDIILKNFAKLLTENTNGDDTLIRFGGDEFMIVLNNTSLHKSKTKMTEIQAKFENIVDDPKISFSYGIHPFDATLNITIDEADKKMYHMKRMMKETKIFP